MAKRTLEREGPVTRPQLRERIAAAGVALDQQTGLHVIGLAVTSGLACLGPDLGRSACLVLREDWLGKMPRFDRDAALAELARRYLGAFGPATDRDFAYWSGLPLGQVRQGLRSIAGELEESKLGAAALLSLRDRRVRMPRAGQLRMLGAFDTYMLGYRDRDFALPSEHRAHLKAGGGGWLRPVIVRDGVVVGGWSYRRKGGRVEVELRDPDSLSAADREAIDVEVADIGRFEGCPLAPLRSYRLLRARPDQSLWRTIHCAQPALQRVPPTTGPGQTAFGLLRLGNSSWLASPVPRILTAQK